MSNYLETFERLAKCNLPAGIEILDCILDDAFMNLKPYNFVFDCTRASECRAALMLIVDALEANKWIFERTGRYIWDAYPPGVNMTEDGPCVRRYDPDEVTALADCLIAALGVAE